MLHCHVKVAFHPANSLESHSCTFCSPNSPRITFLRKNRGRGVQPPFLARSQNSLSVLFVASLMDDIRLGDWIHHPSNRMQQSPRFPAFVAAGSPRHAASPEQHPPNACHPERSEGSAFFSRIAPKRSPATPRLTQLADFPILLLQMISRVHRHHHHHGTAPRVMMCA
jgi:hypothetical protein